MEDRIVELEVRVSYQDRVIEDLDEVLRSFAARVEELQRELAELKRTIKDGTPSLGSADEKPPHY